MAIDILSVFKSFATKVGEKLGVLNNKVETALALGNDISELYESLTGLDEYIHSAFIDGIVDPLEAKNIASYINTLETNKSSLDSKYEVVYGNPFLSSINRTNLFLEKERFDNLHNSLIFSIDNAIADNKASEEEIEEVQSKFTQYRAGIKVFTAAIENALGTVISNQTESKIEAVKIGGRNLIQGSETLKLYEQDGIYFHTFQSNELEWPVPSLMFAANGTADYNPQNVTDYLEGIHTFSIDVKGEQTATIQGNEEQREFAVVPDRWTRIFITADLIGNIRIELTGITDYRRPKLETGNKATDYTITPEDVDKKIQDQMVYVEYSPDGVNWGLSFDPGDKYMRQRKGSGDWTDAIQIVGEKGAAGENGQYTDYQFAKNTSTETAPTSGWQDAPPSTSEGEFVWMRSGRVIPPAETPATWSIPVRLTGAKGEKGDQGLQGLQGKDGEQGIPGPKGADGQIFYTWIRYADDEEGSGISNLPAGKEYIGFAYNRTSEEESSNPNDYKWSLIKGPQGNQGVEGPKGADGITTYTWIKYSDNASGSEMYDIPTASTEYIGIATNKTVQLEGTNPNDYKWSQFKGDRGPQGVKGEPGEDGKVYYTWIAYAVGPNGEGINNSPAGKTYIGFAYNQDSPDEVYEAGLYKWSLIKGEKGDTGVKGEPGEDGTERWTWIRYSDHSDGTNHYDVPNVNTKYIGIATNQTSASEGADKTAYKWSKFRGEQGPQGVPGPAGEDGLTSYFHIRYSSVENPQQASEMSETPDDYIGTYVDYTLEDSDDPNDYTWTRFKGLDGEKGIAGENGVDGKTHYLHIAYADSEDGLNFTTGEAGDRSYIGTYTNFEEDDSNDWQDYSWKKFRGEPIASDTEPENKYAGMVWIDTSLNPPKEKVWDGSEWNVVGLGLEEIVIGENLIPHSERLRLHKDGDTYFYTFQSNEAAWPMPSLLFAADGKADYNPQNVTDYLDGVHTFGIDVKGSGAATLKANEDIKTFNATARWNRVHISTEVTDGIVRIELEGITDYRKPKLAKSNVATEWTPNPADVEDKILDQTIYREYSPDGVNWGLSFDEGDVFMRERKGDGQWSKPIRIVGEKGAVGEEGRYKDFQFAKNTSTETPPTTGWQDAPPVTSLGEYTWMRSGEVIPPATEPAQWSTPVRVTGQAGKDGKDGTDGEPGPKGDATYTWIRYADDENGNGISDSPTGKEYIGFAYNQTSPNELNTPSLYKWSLVKGPKGDQGIRGENGADGQPTYTWIKYSDNADGSGMYDSPTEDTLYIGIATNKSQQQEGTNRLDYKWSRFKGGQGVKGDDGLTSYFHVKYSAIANPQFPEDISETPDDYIGTYSDYTQSDSPDPDDYTWRRFRGFDGSKGEPGTNGIDGKTYYWHVAYADSPDGSANFTTGDAEDRSFMGTYVDLIEDDSEDWNRYDWKKLRGEPIASDTEPQNRYPGMVWIDTSKNPIEQKTWDGSQWYIVGLGIGDIEPGGRNYLLGSKRYAFAGATYKGDCYSVDGNTTFVAHTNNLSWPTPSLLFSADGLAGDMNPRNVALDKIKGKITFSLDVKGTGQLTLIADDGNSTETRTFTLSDQWQRVGVSITADTYRLEIHINSNGLDYRLPQVEKANIINDWKAAPEDAEKNQSAVDLAEEALRRSIADLRGSVNDFQDNIHEAIIDPAISDVELSNIKKHKNAILSQHANVVSSYNVIYGNSHLTGTPKTQLNTSYNSYVTAKDDLLSDIDAAILNNHISPSEAQQINTRFDNFRTRISELYDKIKIAQEAINTAIANQFQVSEQEWNNYVQTVEDLEDRDYTVTELTGNVLTTGTLEVGNTTNANAGITGVTDKGDKSVRIYAGAGFEGRDTAPTRILHNGEFYTRAATIESATGNSLEGLTMKDGLMTWRDPSGKKRMEIGFDDGAAVFSVYNELEDPILVMGPNGISYVNYVPESWRSRVMHFFNPASPSFDEAAMKASIVDKITTVETYSDSSYSRYNIIGKAGIMDTTAHLYNAGVNAESYLNKQYENILYANRNNVPTDFISNGWYGSFGSGGNVFGGIEVGMTPNGYKDGSFSTSVRMDQVQNGVVLQSKFIPISGTISRIGGKITIN